MAKKEQNEDFSIDFDKEKAINSMKATWNFIVKYRVWLLLLIPLIISFNLRIATADLDVTTKWAQDTVYGNLKSQITAQINAQHPNLDQTYKTELVNQQYQEALKSQRAQLDMSIEETAKYFKSRFQNEDNVTYLVAIDPYFYLREAEAIVENGHPGQELRDGKPFDPKKNAPAGNQRKLTFHPLLTAWIYKLANLIGIKTTVFEVAFFMPLIFSVLAVIPAFFLARRIAGNLAGVLSGIIVAIHPSYLTRTIAGFSDTDAYNVLFPLLISWMLFEALHHANKKHGIISKLLEKLNIKKESFFHKYHNQIIYAALAGLFTGIFSFAWSGWWYVFDFLVATLGIYGIYYIVTEYLNSKKFNIKKLLEKDQFKIALFVGIFYLVFSAMFVAFIGGIDQVSKPVMDPIKNVNIKAVASNNIWPNVMTTVAELNAADYKSAINNIGGLSSYSSNLFLLACIIGGVFLTVLEKKKSEPRNIMYFLFVTIWIFGSMYMASRGVRFVMLMVPGFAIGFGVAISKASEYLAKLFESMDVKKGQKIIAVAVMIIVAMSFLQLYPSATKGMYGKALSASQGTVPSLEDAWVSTLDAINQDSNETAIINSWWDFGHQFLYFSDRGVIFDGASQQVAAHWTGRLLITDDEKEARDISRMLVCSGRNIAYDTLESYMDDSLSSLYLLKEIIGLTKEEAQTKLQEEGLEDFEIENVLMKTHCIPPDHYIIASEDMIGKAGVWGHFGSWNFTRANMYLDAKKLSYDEGKDLLMKTYSLSEIEAEKTYNEIRVQDADRWVAPWPGYVSGETSCVPRGDIIICPNIGFTLNLTSGEALVQTQQGIGIPTALVTLDGAGEFVEYEYDNSTFPYSISLYPSNSGYKAIMSYPQIATSVFNRMFFFNGAGLKYFDQFKHDTTVTGLDIYTYKLNWDGVEEVAVEEEEEEVVEEVVEEVELSDNPVVVINTSMGVIKAELFEDKVPTTVANFKKYVEDEFYSDVIFHRIIDGFMIQTGGFTSGVTQKQATYDSIELEVMDDLKHVDGALSMARTNDPNSATSQFFICDGAQEFLDNQYAVFGQVTEGMDVVREISAVETTTVDFYSDVPKDDVVIYNAYLEE